MLGTMFIKMNQQKLPESVEAFKLSSGQHDESWYSHRSFQCCWTVLQSKHHEKSNFLFLCSSLQNCDFQETSYCNFSDFAKVKKDNSSCQKAHTIPQLSFAQKAIIVNDYAKIPMFKWLCFKERQAFATDHFLLLSITI